MTSALASVAPSALRHLASLPHSGQAAAALRRVDPWWNVTGELRTYSVNFECEGDGACPTCGCECGEWNDTETETIEVEARSPEEAEKLAKAKIDKRVGWDFVSVDPPAPLKIKLPIEFDAVEAVASFARQIARPWLLPARARERIEAFGGDALAAPSRSDESRAEGLAQPTPSQSESSHDSI